jgi:hypothetical protein
VREDIKIDVVVSDEDNLCAFTGDFFDPADAEAMVEFAKKMGYRSEVIHTERRFSTDWRPYRKVVHKDIQWNDPRVIYTCIKMRKAGDTYDDIVVALHSESTGFAVKIRLSEIWEQYNLWRDTIQGEITDDMLMTFAQRFVAQRG